MKPCPVCREQIQDVAVKCRFCGEVFDSKLKRRKRTRRGVPWYRKVLFALGWWIILYVAECMIVGPIVAWNATSGHPNTATDEAYRATQQFGVRWSPVLLLVPAALAGAGCWCEILPGTRPSDRR